jgi:hypothetical protein
MNKKIMLVVGFSSNSIGGVVEGLAKAFPEYSVHHHNHEKQLVDFVGLQDLYPLVPALVVCSDVFPWVLENMHDADIPQRVVVQGPHLAGTRCWGRFREYFNLKSVPWVYFYTRGHGSYYNFFSDKNTRCLQAGSSIQPLLDLVAELLLDRTFVRQNLLDVLNKRLVQPGISAP